MATIVITGCNRGIGLELCSQYSKRGDDVIGVCRRRSDELDMLGVEVISDIDVSIPEDVEQLAERVGARSVDTLINNAGILRSDTLQSVSIDTMLEQFRINALGPLWVTRSLLGCLGPGSKVAIVSSRVGSIGDNSSGGNYGYRTSKAAVNMIGTNLKHDLAGRGIALALLHPGYVATGMTGGHGVSAVDSARGLIGVVDRLTLDTSGRFWHAEGYELPW